MLQDNPKRKRCVFYAPQSETKDGGALASRRKDAPPSDKGQKIHIFSMHRNNGIGTVRTVPKRIKNCKKLQKTIDRELHSVL